MPLGNKENPWGYLAVFIAIVFVALSASFLFVALNDAYTDPSSVEILQTEGEQITITGPLSTEVNDIDTTENRVNLTLLDDETGESVEILNLYDDPSNGATETTVAIRSESITVTNNGVIGGDSVTENGSSVHTNDTDFDGATTLNGVEVVGSGASASVELQSGTVIDDFEDGSISEYSGDTGSFSVQSTTGVTSGSNALQGSASDNELNSISDVNSLGNVSQGDDIRYNIQIDNTDDDQYQTGFGLQSEGGFTNGYWVRTQPRDDKFILQKNNDGITVLDSTPQTYTEGEQYEVLIEWGDSGQITVTLFDSSDTQLAQVSTTDTDFSEGGLGFVVNAIGPGGNPTAYWDFYRTGTGSGSGTYVSSTHMENGVTEGFTNLTLSNTTATVTWIADTDGDGSFETEAGSDTFTTTGNHSIDLSGTDSSSWRVNVTFTTTDDPNTAELHSEGVLFQSSSGSASGAQAVLSYQYPVRYGWTDEQSAAVDAIVTALIVTLLLVIVGGVGYYAIGSGRS